MYEINTGNSTGVFPSHDHTLVHVVPAAKAVVSTVQNPTLLLTQIRGTHKLGLPTDEDLLSFAPA